jgi:hypothetical protein
MFNKNLEKKVDSLEKTLVIQNGLFSSFLAKLDAFLERMEKKTDDNGAWMKSLHEMALKEYMAGPKKRVYAFIYDKPQSGEKRLILSARDTFEEAHESVKKSLESLGESPDRDWTMFTYKYLDIPYANASIVDEVEKQLPSFEKPIDYYLNQLELAKDKFATPAQKKVFDSVIKKIKKQY